jgi:predicted RNase H-like HicB family nuclease
VTTVKERTATKYLLLTCTYQPEGKWITARCQELGTSTVGKTLDEAEDRLREAILLHLDTLEEVGERGRFFKEHGIRLHATYPKEVRPTVPPDVLSKTQVVAVDAGFAFA